MTKACAVYNHCVPKDGKAWFREPLVHFVVLGALVFVAYRGLVGPNPTDHVTPEQAPVEQLRQDWFAAKGAFPTAEQEAALIQEWLDEEVLYRRAVELGLDQNDTVVRRRLVQRMRFLIEDTHRIEAPSDAELEAWLEAHPHRFASPAKVSFAHLFFSRGKHGTELDAVARAALAELHGDPAAAVDSDPFFRGAAFEEVALAEIERGFGVEFAKALVSLPVEQWTGPVRSAYGLHLVYIRTRDASEAPRLDTVREKVEQDWVQAERERHNDDALAKLRARYADESLP